MAASTTTHVQQHAINKIGHVLLLSVVAQKSKGESLWDPPRESEICQVDI